MRAHSLEKVDLAVQVTAEWAPGKYSSMFSDAKASTHPVLELSTDILKHLAHSDACKKRMHDLYLESTLDRLLRTEEGMVREHVLKVLWVLRDHEQAVESARAIASHVDKLHSISANYSLTPNSSSKLARRLQAEQEQAECGSAGVVDVDAGQHLCRYVRGARLQVGTAVKAHAAPGTCCMSQPLVLRRQLTLDNYSEH
jgi:hypothetical protein